eukprot:TRINITY_DN5583_c0_g2_i1.p1 TRINITY_DN5583_c0_g2~~TRINITY_DN5583_c0_g2_i1.p1  ORF type:complete len:162 (-),score=8.00 TRINITY_DN5583_c0_g2_i1:347-832(-)
MMEKGSPSKLRVIPNGDGKKRGVSVAAKIKQISGEAVTELLPRGPNCLFVKLNAGKSVAVSDVARSLWGERIVMRRVWRREGSGQPRSRQSKLVSVSGTVQPLARDTSSSIRANPSGILVQIHCITISIHAVPLLPVLTRAGPYFPTSNPWKPLWVRPSEV